MCQALALRCQHHVLLCSVFSCSEADRAHPSLLAESLREVGLGCPYHFLRSCASRHKVSCFTPRKTSTQHTLPLFSLGSPFDFDLSKDPPIIA